MDAVRHRHILVYAPPGRLHLGIRQADAFIQNLAEGPSAWAIPWPCLYEFFAIVTHPRIYKPPTPPGEAILQIDAWLEAPGVSLLHEGDRFWETLRELLRGVSDPRWGRSRCPNCRALSAAWSSGPSFPPTVTSAGFRRSGRRTRWSAPREPRSALKTARRARLTHRCASRRECHRSPHRSSGCGRRRDATSRPGEVRRAPTTDAAPRTMFLGFHRRSTGRREAPRRSIRHAGHRMPAGCAARRFDGGVRDAGFPGSTSASVTSRSRPEMSRSRTRWLSILWGCEAPTRYIGTFESTRITGRGRSW